MTTRTRGWALLFLGAVLGAVACAEYHLPLGPDAGGDGVGDGGEGGQVDDGGAAFDAGTGNGQYDAGFAACIDVGRKVVLTPLDLFILLDVSYSMDYDFKWTAVSSAMKSFTTNSAFTGMGVGVQYFPLRAQCRTDVYLAPAVPIAPLPGNAGPIGFSLDMQRMSGGTPMVPALSGALAYTKSYLSQALDAGHRAAVVLATDGVPDDSCAGDADAGVLPNTIANVEVVARGGVTSSPVVKTFVVGVGKELGVLDSIAAAGGTDRAVLVDVAANADVQFLAALTQIRKDALGCTFAVPTDKQFDGTMAHVEFVPDDGSADLAVPQVTGKVACGGGQGWYFEDLLPDGGLPLLDAGVGDGGSEGVTPKVVLCEATCDVITGGRTGDLRVEFPCGIR